MSKITLSFMQRFMGNLDTAIRNFVIGITGDKDDLQTTAKDSLVNAINEVNSHGGASSLDGLSDVSLTSPSSGQTIRFNGTNWVNSDSITYKTQTLTAGNTSVTFTDIPTTGVHIADIYTSKVGLDYTSIDDSTAGSLVVTYEAQLSDITVYLKIEGI